MCQVQIVQPESLATEITRTFPPKKFISSFHFVYRDQVPNICIVLESGEVELQTDHETLRIHQPGTIIGFRELLNDIPSDLTAVVKASSRVSIIDKGSVLELMSSNPSISRYLNDLARLEIKPA